MSQSASAAWYDVAPDTSFSFKFERGSLRADDESTGVISSFLLNSLVDTAYTANLASQYGLDKVKAYLENRRFGSTLRTLVADFGEVVAGELLKAHEGHAKPIEKLRYKDHHDFPLHLTDVLCVRTESEAITAFVYCEVKAGTTAPNKAIGTKALASILKDWVAKMPEILYFTSEKLWQEGRLKEQRAFDEAIYRQEPMPRALRIIFVFDEAVWDDDVLNNLEAAFLTSEERGEDLGCYLLTCNDMRQLIERSYKAASESRGQSSG